MPLLNELTPASIFDFPVPEGALPDIDTPYVQNNLDILKLYRAIQESKKTPLARQTQQKAKERAAAKKQTAAQYYAAVQGKRLANDPVKAVLASAANQPTAIPPNLTPFGADPYGGLNDDGFLTNASIIPQHGGTPPGGLYGGLDAPDQVAPMSPQQRAAVIASIQPTQAAPAPQVLNAYDARLNPFGVGSGYEELQRPRQVQ